MKTLILSFALISASVFGGSPISENGDYNNVCKNTNDDDALRCKVTITDSEGNSVTSSCWFCDCEENHISAVATLEGMSND